MKANIIMAHINFIVILMAYIDFMLFLLFDLDELILIRLHLLIKMNAKDIFLVQ